MYNKQLWHLLLIFVSISMLIGCGGEEKPATAALLPTAVLPTPTTAVSHSTIRIGISPDVPPFMFLAEGKLAGFDYDLINSLAPNLNLPVEFVEINDWAKAYDGLVNQQYDVVISAASVNPHAEAAVQFTTPYFTTGQAAITLVNSPIQTQADLNQKVIAVQAGTTGEQWVGENLDAERRPFNSLEAALTAVQEGRADVAIYDHIPAVDYINSHHDTGLDIRLTQLTQESYGIAVRQDDTETLNQLNNALQAFLNTETYRDLCQTWGIAPGCNPTVLLAQTVPAANSATAIEPTETVVTSTPTDAGTAVPVGTTVLVSPDTITLNTAQSCEIVNLDAQGTRYVVQVGDTLWKIAEQHYGQGIYYRAIAAFNPDMPDPSVVRLGKEINIPPRQQADDLMHSLVPRVARY